MEGVPPLSTAPPWSSSTTAVIILAAGASNRMGRPKPLLPFSDSETFLEHLLGLYAAIESYPIIVLAPGCQEVLDRLSASGRSFTIAFNDQPERGRYSSVICGLSYAPPDRYVFVQDVDRPFVGQATLHALYAHRHSCGVTSPHIGGHPPLLSPHVVRELLRNPTAATLRDALAPFDRTLVPSIEPGGELNINTPEDYQTHVRRKP